MPKLILFIIIYPFLFILYFLMKHAVHHNSRSFFNVTVPFEYQALPEIKEIKDRYYQKLYHTILASAMIATAILLVPSSSIALTLIYLWIFITFISVLFPYSQANGEMRELKLYHIINRCKSRNIKKDKELIQKEFKKFNSTFFIIFDILNILPCIYAISAIGDLKNSINVLTIATICCFFGFFLHYFASSVCRKAPQLYCLDINVNIDLNRRNKKVWSRILKIITVFNTSYLLIIFCIFQKLMNQPIYFILLAYLYFGTVIALLLHCLSVTTIYQLRKLHSMEIYNNNEDQQWIWGIFYSNRADSRIIIPSRFLALSLNKARKVGRILDNITNLIVFTGLCICIWSIFIEYTPIELSIQDHQLVATQLREEHVIDIDSIDELGIIEGFPVPIVNHGFASVVKGTYKIDSYGNSTVFLVPTNSYFIHIIIDEYDYFLSSKNDEETLKIYDTLLRMIDNLQ